MQLAPSGDNKRNVSPNVASLARCAAESSAWTSRTSVASIRTISRSSLATSASGPPSKLASRVGSLSRLARFCHTPSRSPKASRCRAKESVTVPAIAVICASVNSRYWRIGGFCGTVPLTATCVTELKGDLPEELKQRPRWPSPIQRTMLLGTSETSGPSNPSHDAALAAGFNRCASFKSPSFTSCTGVSRDRNPTLTCSIPTRPSRFSRSMSAYREPSLPASGLAVAISRANSASRAVIRTLRPRIASVSVVLRAVTASNWSRVKTK